MTDRNLFEYFKNSYKHIISCDSEFIPSAGNLCEVLCFVYRDVITGEVWRCENRQQVLDLPFNLNETLIVVFYATAEFESWIAWNCPLPTHVLDLWLENKNIFQTGEEEKGTFTMLNVAKNYDISKELIMDDAEKNYWRDIALETKNYTKELWQGLLDYCEKDTVLTAALVTPTLKQIEDTCLDIPIKNLATQIVARGFSKGLEAWVYANGISCDVAAINDYNKFFPQEKSNFLSDKNKILNCYDDNGTFKNSKFVTMLAEIGLLEAWDKTKSGQYSTSKATFDKFKGVHPKLTLFREVKRILESDQVAGFCVGNDGRSRGLQRFRSTITGRAASSSTNNPFMSARWTRNLIKADEGKVLVYIDYAHQEPCIQAALSGDTELLKAVTEPIKTDNEGNKIADVYLYTATHTGALRGVNDQDRINAIRKKYKVFFLANSYGMGKDAIAIQLGISPYEAEEMRADIRRLYSKYYNFMQKLVTMFQIRGHMSTVLGWNRFCRGKIKNHRSLMNWPIQSHGAEILMWALQLLYHNKFKVVATVHDAMLVEFDDDEHFERNLSNAQRLMQQASKDVIGLEVKTDAEIIRGNWKQSGDALKVFEELMTYVEKGKRCNT